MEVNPESNPEKIIVLDNTCNLKYYGDILHPQFVLTDVCKEFEMDKKNRIIKDVLCDEFLMGAGGHPLKITVKAKNGQNHVMINQYQLYEIMFRSDSDKAKSFRRILMNILEKKRTEMIDELPQLVKENKRLIEENIALANKEIEKPKKHRFIIEIENEYSKIHQTYHQTGKRVKQILNEEKKKRNSEFSDILMKYGVDAIKITELPD